MKTCFDEFSTLGIVFDVVHAIKRNNAARFQVDDRKAAGGGIAAQN